MSNIGNQWHPPHPHSTAYVSINFSTVFSIIRLHQMTEVLCNWNFSLLFICWSPNYLTDHRKLGQEQLHHLLSSLEPPRTVSSALFHTTRWLHQPLTYHNMVYFKFLDDAVILALLSVNNPVSSYHVSVHHFTCGCSDSFQELNVDRTNKLVIQTSHISLWPPSLSMRKEWSSWIPSNT